MWRVRLSACPVYPSAPSASHRTLRVRLPVFHPIPAPPLPIPDLFLFHSRTLLCAPLVLFVPFVVNGLSGVESARAYAAMLAPPPAPRIAYAAMVAVVIALHGPRWPLVPTQRTW